MMETVLIAGAGLAGSRCAEALRTAGFDGRIVLAGEESVPPYERPALSKQLLAGDRHDVFLRPHEHWEELDIELLLGVRVHSLDLRSRTAVAGRKLAWDNFVLATGARLRRPGGLRTLADALALRERLVPGTRLAIVGAGFVGTEVASTALGLGVDVTLVEAGPAPLAGLLGREVGDLLARRARDHGLDLRTQTTEVPDHDVLLWAVGVEPARELLPGFEVDACGRTQVPHVYACGDVTGTGHWTAAAGQAVAVAWAILGEHRPYEAPPYVWSDQFGLRLQLAGDPAGAARVELQGNNDDFRVRYRDASGRVRAILLGIVPERSPPSGRSSPPRPDAHYGFPATPISDGADGGGRPVEHAGSMECAIQKTLGLTEQCTGAKCPFWEIAANRIAEGCFVQKRFGTVLKNREVAAWLAGLRRSLQRIRIDEGSLQ